MGRTTGRLTLSFCVCVSSQVFDKIPSRYGKILRHVRCKMHSRSRPVSSKRWTYLQRPPRSSKTSADTNKDTKDTPHWYALRTTYGREKKAYDYLLSKGVEAFYPILKNVKLVDDKRIIIEESRIPNIFFAYGTEEELKTFVYDNVNLPYLRFYYRHTHVGNMIVKVPLVVPENQMNSLKIICATDSDDIIASTEEVEKFKTGQKVRITEGKFAGVTGIVARYQSQQRVGIVIDGLLTVATAYIPSAFIEEDR